MKFWPTAASLIVGLGVVFWLVSARSPLRTHARTSAEPSTAVNERELVSRLLKQSADAGLPGQIGVAYDSERSGIMANAVMPAPPAAVLASLAEPPSAPETQLDVPPLAVLENLRSAFQNYRQRFGGNPVGNNAEITLALNAGNPQGIAFIHIEEGLRTNERGELVDNWNTPFFFHQLSRTEMEIRSAGADRKLWTVDDLVFK